MHVTSERASDNRWEKKERIVRRAERGRYGVADEAAAGMSNME